MTRPLACLALVFGALACDDFASPAAPMDAAVLADAASDASPQPQVDAGDAGGADGGLRGPRRVFVTSRQTDGSMTFGEKNRSGVAGADVECQEEADAAGLKGVFIALLPTSNVESGRERFELATRNVVLVNGVQVAMGFGTLFGLGPTVPIALTAAGASVPAPETVYTGSSSAGATNAANCAFWTTNAANGSYGSLAKGGDWLDAPTQAIVECKVLRRVYCFER